MAFADKTDGSRIILGAGPGIPIVVATAVLPGDLLTEAGGRADANAATPAPAAFVAGAKAAANETVVAYRSAIVSGVTGATKGNKVYLSDTAGGYSETPSTTQRQAVGFSIAATAMYVEPKRDVDRFAVTTSIVDATYDQDRYFFVARERCRVTAIEFVQSAIEATGNATTVMVRKVVTADGIDHANQKDLMAAALNLKTGVVANTVLSAGLTATAADLVLEKGNSLALDFTNAITEYVGTCTVWLEPA